MASHETKNPLCKPCLVQKKHAAAAVICQECENEYLCEECLDDHKSQNVTKSHNLLPIEDLKNTAVQVDHVTGILTKFESLTVRVVHETTQSVERIMTSHMTDENQSKSPGKPRALEVGCDSMTLCWDPPSFFKEGFYFQISYKECTHDTSKWKPYDGEFTDPLACISNLKANTPFVFRVRVVYGDEEGPYSAVSEKFTTTSSPASRLAKSCKHIGVSTTPQTLQPPLQENKYARNASSKTRMFEIGDSKGEKNEKIIMMIGETGSGKSTLVDGMVNYILGVNWDDPFRFSIITLEPEEQKKSSNQAESQTEWITCYKVHTGLGSRIPYSITIIDTPGFGDTRGLTRDNEIVSQIRALFSTKPPCGVLTIDAVCFLMKAPDARLTALQTYIFQSVMSLFGKDIKDNICSLITFADGKDPPVLAALKQTDLPFGKHFNFNNSALFATNSNVNKSSLSPLFWNMGVSSFENFFQHLESLERKSLQLTSDVLNERYRLEMTLKCLEPCLNDGILKLNELKREKDMFKEHEQDISENENYTVEVEVPKPIQVNKPVGTFVTNCIDCSITCHEVCKISNDSDKMKCCAMDKTNGYCKICEQHCKWDRHFNMPYIFKSIVVKEQRTLAQIKQRYEEALGKKLTAQQIIDELNNDIKDLAETIDDMLEIIHESKTKLDEIALRPNPLNMTDLIELMIENEKNSKKDGYLRRIEELNNIRKRACIEDDVKVFSENAKVLGVSVVKIKKDRLTVMARLRKWLPWNFFSK